MNAKKVAFTVRQNAAIDFARMYHKTQRRKGTPVPYLIHPMEVAYFLGRFYPDNEDLIIAGYLHDVLEDTEASYESVSELFGENVANLVQGVTATKLETWRETRQAQHNKLRDTDTPLDVIRLKAADMLSNAQSTARDLRVFGISAFARSKASPQDNVWYYTGARAAMRGRFPGKLPEPLVIELHHQVEFIRLFVMAHHDDILYMRASRGDCACHPKIEPND